MKVNVFVSLTKSGKKSVRYADGICSGRKLDKCSMSNYFPVYSYYSIYWYDANYNRMVDEFLSLSNVVVLNDIF